MYVDKALCRCPLFEIPAGCCHSCQCDASLQVHTSHTLSQHPPDGDISVGLQPLHRPHPRLVRQGVVVADVAALQLAHDEADALLHLLLVGVPCLLHIRHRDAMGAEEDLYIILQGHRAAI